MPMQRAYLDAIAAAGGRLITHLGLVDESGAELVGGSPAYVRQAVTWSVAEHGIIRPTTNLVFAVPPETTVGGFRAYSSVSDGVDYGGERVTPERFAGQGEYILLADRTGILHG